MPVPDTSMHQQYEHTQGQNEPKPGIITNLLQVACDRREMRLDKRQQRRDVHSNHNSNDAAADGQTPMKSHGSVKELHLPKGFAQVNDRNVEKNFGESRVAYQAKDSPSSRICYSKDSTWLPSSESQASLKKLLAEPAKSKLTDEEVDAISEVIPRPPFGCNGAFTVTALSTKEIDSKKVLVMELSEETSGKRVYGYFFNPVYAKPEATSDTTGSLESLWFESPGKDFRRHEKAALQAIHSAKLKG